MATKKPVIKIDGTNRIILAADALYLTALMLISTQMKIGTLDYVLLVLVILSLAMLGAVTFKSFSSSIVRLINLMQVVLAAVISLRFLIMFFSDSSSIASLLLYGAVIMFFYVAVNGVWRLVRDFTPAAKKEE
ncbi:MAG: hypothetical protein COA47_02020 [Robiginitomaculum sp.]|nr:MAG: hypothetical protein COA47_02020 [Robiginitomaculum sp.]